MLPGFQGI